MKKKLETDVNDLETGEIVDMCGGEKLFDIRMLRHVQQSRPDLCPDILDFLRPITVTYSSTEIYIMDQGKNPKWRVSSYFHSSFSPISSQFSNPVGHSLTFTLLNLT